MITLSSSSSNSPSSSNEKVTRSLTLRYIFSLGAVALFAIGGQVLIQQQLSRQESDLKIVRIAQERQTICQRMLKGMLGFSLTPNPSEADRQKIREIMVQWKNSRSLLRDNMMVMLNDREMAELDQLFVKLEAPSKEILTTAQQLIDQSSPSQIERFRSRLKMPNLMKAEREFEQITDEIVNWYSLKVKNNVRQLKLLESALLTGTLLLLGLEALLIFRPAVTRLRSTLMQLSQALASVQAEQEKSEKLLLNILPSSIADRLKLSSESIADGFSEATVLFADIVGFTELSSRLSPQELVACLNQIFSSFDALAEKHGLEKIKTIGDAYMVVGGLPKPRADHAIAVAQFALEMRSELQKINQSLGETFDIRIGINSGPVVAGVIGIKKFIYDLWGDTVNVASRMESHGQPGEIHVTEAFYEQVRSTCDCEFRGTIPIKGKGEMKTYWLRSAPRHLGLTPV